MTAAKQTGITLGGTVVAAFFLVAGLVVAFKLVPAYVEFFTIRKVLNDIAANPEYQNASSSTIRTAYARRAQVENITIVKAEDLDVAKENGNLVLSASYSTKLPLVGNVSACVDFEATTSKR